jgi:serine/threonine protein kinase, bacterial
MRSIADPLAEEPSMRMSCPSTPGRRRRLAGSLTAVAVAAAAGGLLGASLKAPVAGAAPAHAALSPAAPANANLMVTLLQRGISKPAGMVAANGSTLYVADTGNNRVVRLNGTTQTTLPFAGLQGPAGVAVDAAGDVWVADTGHNRVVEFGGQESVPTTIVPPVLPLGTRHLAVAADAAGDVVYTVGSHVWEIKAGTTTPVLLPFTNHGLYEAVAIDRRGDVFAMIGAAVMELAIGGTTSPATIVDMSVDGAADIAVIELGGPVAELIAGTTMPNVLLFTAVTSPTAVAIDSHGDVFAADTPVVGGGAALGAHIYELAAGATVALSLATDGFPYVNGMAVDGLGHVFVAGSGGMLEAHAN